MTPVLLLTHTPFEKHSLPKARPMRRTARIELLSRIRPRAHDRMKADKVKVGCLSHAPHEDLGPVDLANAKRRVDFYSRWHGLEEPLLQIWKAP
ncbi:hypothetical protein FZZ93_17020 [Halomonas eurihalina]|uniref:Uncharacterized protein n=1 Tax=Halomonas eurihalina TaxID=42566 RepID=A0A5D9CJT1_HALER|nr:hypothetical protein [Halomonas eurihalina]MDR5858436.1 hypothetical protein [Halomonas eurihalina]TZG31686.1 hypothetical protein FZZ93_17020 [Halomonas eurihalina]